MKVKNQFLVLILISVGIGFSFVSISESFGHGIGFEVLPPVELGDRMVSLEVTSSQYADPDSPARQISFTLFDIDTGNSLRDVTFQVEASKGNSFLFEDSFEYDDGIMLMEFIPSDSKEIIIKKEKREGSFIDSLLFGSNKDTIVATGNSFSTGGLYKFKVKILTADSYSNKLDESILFDVGLSIPDRSYLQINDPNFGEQEVTIISYYDKIEDFQYKPNIAKINFEMPFDWSFENINQTSVVHEELVFTKTFGDLLVSQYSLLINDKKVPERVLTIDGFSEKNRIVHIILNQNDLLELLKTEDSGDKMKFELKPKEKDIPLSTITGNGQYKIVLDWEPRDIQSGSKTTFLFDIMDVFLKDRPVSVPYEVSIVSNGNEIFHQNGVSTDSRDEHNNLEFIIPENISGPITLQFENLNDNGLARVGIPVVVNRILDEDSLSEVSIPDWVRNNAGWWSKGTITDNDFASGIEFLIKEEIIKVPPSDNEESHENAVIPDWVKNTAGWWSEGIISDNEFANGLQYLIRNGIISV